MPKRVSKPRKNPRDPYRSKSYRALVAAVRLNHFGAVVVDNLYSSATRLGFMRRMLNLSQGKPISEPPPVRVAKSPPLIPPYDPHKKYVIPDGLKPISNSLLSSIKLKYQSK
jgi:hypothetical protein